MFRRGMWLEWPETAVMFIAHDSYFELDRDIYFPLMDHALETNGAESWKRVCV